MRKQIIYFLFFVGSILMVSCETEKPLETVNLRVEITPADAGKVNYSTENLYEGQMLEMTAVPEPNWIFKEWQLDGSGTSTTLNLLLESDNEVLAVFEKKPYPLTITIQGEGTVEERLVENPSGREYPHGSLVELTPKPKEGWVFQKWTGAIEGNMVPAQLNITEETEVTAIFAPKISALLLGGSEDDVLTKVLKVSGGSYLLAGTTNSSDGIFEGLSKGGQDAFLIQVSPDLVVEWVKVIGGSGNDYTSNVIENNDGTYSLTGSFTSSDGDFSGKKKGQTDIFHLKVSPSGSTIWLNSFGANSTAIFSNSMIQSKLGFYVLMGTTEGECCNQVPGNKIGGKDIVLMWISEAGDLLWSRNYGSFEDDEGTALIETNDNNIKIVGTQQPRGAQNQEDILVINMDSNGNQLSKAVYSGSGTDIAYDIVQNQNSLLLVGSTTSTDGDFYNNGLSGSNLFLMDLAPSGSGLGTLRLFGGNQTDIGMALLKSPASNEFFVLGCSDSQDIDLANLYIGESDLVMMKVDSYLNKKSIKAYGGTKSEGYFSMPFGADSQKFTKSSLTLSKNGGLILGGTTESNDQLFEGMNHGKKDIFLIETDLSGNLK
ncbi:hypothetical protein FHS59_003896 [Algoriphagus iocasae]|uniref:Bacterial repeat domain-containing protein n=1 Tax=Algoriphagus iocasae TaxID=1836499 RepID=A0A841MMW6_9BACT|nr:hypothetical protein [Algoriphagus iocasae]MBB6328253.1 hypothetical protein [Algoriphagus iocasae]